MALYEVNSDNLTKISQTTFDQAGLRERADLQRLLKRQIEVILPDILIISEEFGEWEESKRRIDLLGLDENANIVVVELKRTEDGGHMDLQAIRYASMVSTMTFDQVVDVYDRFLIREGFEGMDARSAILEFLGWNEANDDLFAQNVRIVLASSNFSKELTTAVIWLNNRDLDIRCIRVIPYRYNDKILVNVQQIIPLPEAAEYQIKYREKERQERRGKEYSAIHYDFWEQLLEIAKARSNLYENISPTTRDAIRVKSIRGLKFHHVINRFTSRVELYIERADKLTNKKIFDELFKSRNEIDTAFGQPLSWERLDLGKASRIGFYFESGYKNDESEWPEIHANMVDAMIRLEGALSPFLD